jgi:hypothetical protein
MRSSSFFVIFGRVAVKSGIKQPASEFHSTSGGAESHGVLIDIVYRKPLSLGLY